MQVIGSCFLSTMSHFPFLPISFFLKTNSNLFFHSSFSVNYTSHKEAWASSLSLALTQKGSHTQLISSCFCTLMVSFICRFLVLVLVLVLVIVVVVSVLSSLSVCCRRRRCVVVIGVLLSSVCCRHRCVVVVGVLLSSSVCCCRRRCVVVICVSLSSVL